MNKFIKFFWLLSMIVFLAALLFAYSAMPAEIDIALGSTVVPSFFLSKDAFFYIMVGVVVVTNAILLTLSKVISLMSEEEQHQDEKSRRKEAFRLSVINWLGSFSAILNIFYAIGVTFVGLYNNPAYVKPEQYKFLAYVGLVLVALWLLWFMFIVFRRSTIKEAE